MKKIIYTVIIIHGSNKKSWIKFFKNLKFKIKKNLFYINKIFISFIKKKKPYFLKIINNNLKNLIKNYLIIPLFLGKGKHILYDLKIILRNIIKIYNKIRIFKLNIIDYKNKLIKLFKKNYLRNLKNILNFYIKI